MNLQQAARSIPQSLRETLGFIFGLSPQRRFPPPRNITVDIPDGTNHDPPEVGEPAAEHHQAEEDEPGFISVISYPSELALDEHMRPNLDMMGSGVLTRQQMRNQGPSQQGEPAHVIDTAMPSTSSLHKQETPFDRAAQLLGDDIPNLSQSGLEAEVVKIAHSREKRFQTSDHLYRITLTKKVGVQPYLLSLLNPLRYMIVKVIKSLQTHYAEEDRNLPRGEKAPVRLFYCTIVHKTEIQNGINGGAMVLNSNPDNIALFLISQLYNFLKSNRKMRLDGDFNLVIKTLCVAHSREKLLQYPKVRTLRGRRLGGRVKKRVIRRFTKKSPISRFAKAHWAMCVPEGYARKQYKFKNQCLLVGLIIAYINVLAIENPQSEAACQMRLLRQTRNKNPSYKVGKYVDDFIDRFISLTGNVIDRRSGGHRAEDVFPLFSEHYNIQCRLWNNMGDPLEYQFPVVFDKEMRQLDLHADVNDIMSNNFVLPSGELVQCRKPEGHVEVILNYTKYNNRVAKYCLHCDKSIGPPRKHNCRDLKNRFQNCYTCKRPLLSLNQVRNAEIDKQYCDSKMARESGMLGKKCETCNQTIYTTQCQSWHQKTQCLAGFLCLSCNLYTSKWGPYQTIEALKSSHIHYHKFCKYCKIYTDLKNHSCTMTHAKYQKIWSKIAVLKGMNIKKNLDECVECATLRDSGTSLILCPTHTNEPASECQLETNFLVAFLETEERGVFERKVFADAILGHEINWEEEFNVYRDYFPTDLIDFDKKKHKEAHKCDTPYLREKFAEAVALQLHFKEKKERNVYDALLAEVLQPRYFNTTFIVHGIAHELNFIAHAALQANIQCRTTMRNGRMLLLQFPDKFNLRFLTNSSYYKSSIYELNDRFKIVANPEFFPNCLNAPEYYSLSQLPDCTYFLGPEDSAEKRVSIGRYHSRISQNPYSWNFRSAILSYVTEQLVILLSIVTNTIDESFSFQTQFLAYLRESAQLGPDAEPVPADCYRLLHAYSKPYCTLTAFSFSVMKLYSLNPDTLFSVRQESTGFGLTNNVSRAEHMWTEYFGQKHDIPYRGAYTHEEGQITLQYGPEGNKKLITPDLYYQYSDTGQEIIAFFHGCWTHCDLRPCCPKRKDPGTIKIIGGKKMTWRAIYNRDMAKLEELRKSRPNCYLIVMWNCDWDKLKLTSVDVQTFIASYYPRPLHRLVPRTATRGGQNETFLLDYSYMDDMYTTFSGLDVCSLYPFICTQANLPHGKPTTIIGSQLKYVKADYTKKRITWHDNPCNGLIHCVVEADGRMLYPFLPLRDSHGKVLTATCRTCLENKLFVTCPHRDTERWLVSCWTIAELEYSIFELNYKIIHYLELLIFPNESMFLKPYYLFLSIFKLKYSSPPINMHLKQYTDIINHKMDLHGILKLDPRDCQPCPIKREYYKSMSVNSIGKMGARISRNNVCYVSTHKELSKKVNDSRYDVVSWNTIGPKVMQVQRLLKPEKAGPNRQGNTIAHSVLIAKSRIYMHQQLMKLVNAGIRPYYFETDAFYFERRVTQAIPLDTGFHLGAFADIHPQVLIVRYMSLGARTLCLTTESQGDRKEIIHLKSFCLTSELAHFQVSSKLFQTLLYDMLRENTRTMLENDRKKKAQKAQFPPNVQSPLTQIRYRTKNLIDLRETISSFNVTNAMSQKRIICIQDGQIITYPFGITELPT